MDNKKNRQMDNANENAPPETDPAMFNPDAEGDQLTGALMNDDLSPGDEPDDEDQNED